MIISIHLVAHLSVTLASGVQHQPQATEFMQEVYWGRGMERVKKQKAVLEQGHERGRQTARQRNRTGKRQEEEEMQEKQER